VTTLDLLLLRHAKSSWDVPGIQDHDRDLAPRGEQAAPRMGRLLATLGLVPDRVLCSTARRAVRTWELAGAALEPAPEVIHRREVYMAAPGQLLEAIRRHGGTARRLMLIGHNPGLQALGVRLVGEGDAKLRARLAEKLPTAALARIGFAAARWDEVAWHRGRLLGFWRPRDLD
jgi:phosphohistidine phosphatase